MIKLKNRLVIIGVAFATLALTNCAALEQTPGYRFAIAGQATGSGEVVSVRLVTTGGAPLNAAQIYSVHWRYTGVKTAPGKRQLTPLRTDGHGSFVYPVQPADGRTLRFAARVDDDPQLIWGSVELGR